MKREGYIDGEMGKRYCCGPRTKPEGFGNHIRSYVEGRGVKDSRTGVEQDFAETLDGDIDGFLRASLTGWRIRDSA